MRNRSHHCVCIFALALLLEISLAPICHAEIINVTHRTKREVSVKATPRPKENANYDAKEIQEANLKHEKDDDNLEENDTFLRRKREVAKSSLNPVDNSFQRSNVEKSIDDNAANHLNSRDSNEETDYAEEGDDDMTRRQEHDEDEERSNLVRLSRSADLRYTDQDERSSLYDDYEAKDVAKRGAEDYEEVEEDSPGMPEDITAVREEESIMDKAERKEKRSDARVKRNQATLESLDNNVKSSDTLKSEDRTASEFRLDPGYLEELKTAADESSSREVTNIESSRGIAEPSLLNNGASNKLEGPASNEAISSSSGASAEDTSAKYDKRAEEQIQRKIDSIKDEIRRDIEVQRRIRDIQENNAKFDELQDEENRSSESDSIEKRQSVAKKRSTRNANVVASSKSSDKKRSPEGEPREKPQRRSSEISKSDNSLKKRSLREKPKTRSAKHREKFSGKSPSKGFSKKKRNHVRETILVKKNRHRAKKRDSRSYTSRGNDGKLENELSVDQDLNSYLRANDETVQAPLHLVNEGEDNEEGPSPAGRADSLVSFTGSLQELSPRLAKEYKEAFGGLQSESGNSLARFKRVKRVLSNSDAKISTVQ